MPIVNFLNVREGDCSIIQHTSGWVKWTAGDMKSAKGIETSKSTLRVHLIPEFGELYCNEIRAWHVKQWRNRMATMMAEGYVGKRKLRNGKVQEWTIKLDPGTANTWIGISRTIFAEMTTILELPRNPAAGLKMFDKSSRPTYSKGDTNSLTPDLVSAFLTIVREEYPQHYAMTLLGFATGKRPSTLRPLRASGEECDINWETGEIDWRRSHTAGDAFMPGTKTAAYEATSLPTSVMDVLRWHVAMLKDPPPSKWGKPPLWWREAMAEGELLFPARDGGPRSPSVLDEMVADISKRIGLKKPITPRAMRRTCNDLMRAAKVADVVTRQSRAT
jgi:integrase